MGRNGAKSVALGGVMAALAVVIMCMGGIIPLATYVCPMLCAVLLARSNVLIMEPAWLRDKLIQMAKKALTNHENIKDDDE